MEDIFSDCKEKFENDNLTWHKQMHSLLQRIIHTAKRNRSGIPKEKIQKFTVMYEEILSKAFQKYQSNPPDKVYMDGYNLQKRMRDFQKDHLFFLSHPDIDYTNNISERELRKFKRKQKQAVVLRSDSAGHQNSC